MEDKLRGMLWGLAVGDALGACVEFQLRDSFTPVTGYRAGGPHPIPAGAWTDDTSLALALAYSLKHGFDLDHQMQCYQEWRRAGRWSVIGRCFDIGTQTSSALNHWAGGGGFGADRLKGASCSGNGSIMRLAPVVIEYHGMEPFALGQLCALSSYTTHPSPRCQDACKLLGMLMDALVIYPSEEVLASKHWDIRPQDALRDPAVLSMWNSRGWETKTRNEIKSDGYVLHTLEAALWCFARTDNFRECVQLAVNLGGDADTTGAVAGQLAGAYYGEAGIPQDLLDGLVRRDLLEEALEDL